MQLPSEYLSRMSLLPGSFVSRFQAASPKRRVRFWSSGGIRSTVAFPKVPSTVSLAWWSMPERGAERRAEAGREAQGAQSNHPRPSPHPGSAGGRWVPVELREPSAVLEPSW